MHRASDRARERLKAEGLSEGEVNAASLYVIANAEFGVWAEETGADVRRLEEAACARVGRGSDGKAEELPGGVPYMAQELLVARRCLSVIDGGDVDELSSFLGRGSGLTADALGAVVLVGHAVKHDEEKRTGREVTLLRVVLASRGRESDGEESRASAAALSALSEAGTDMRGRDLSGIRAPGARLCHARLDGADLSGAVLDAAVVGDTSMRGAKLDGASLRRMRLMSTMTSGHTSGVYSVSWSPDGSRIASASGDGTVRVWSARTGDELLRLEGHTNYGAGPRPGARTDRASPRRRTTRQ